MASNSIEKAMKKPKASNVETSADEELRVTETPEEREAGLRTLEQLKRLEEMKKHAGPYPSIDEWDGTQADIVTLKAKRATLTEAKEIKDLEKQIDAMVRQWKIMGLVAKAHTSISILVGKICKDENYFLYRDMENIKFLLYQMDIEREIVPKAILGKQSSKSQSEKARKDRGKGDDGRTMGDLIEGLARAHPNENPSEIWPHLKSAIEEWSGDACEEKKEGNLRQYSYQFGDRKKLISYDTFRKAFAKAKK